VSFLTLFKNQTKQTKERTMTNKQEPNPLDAPTITRLCDYVSDLSRQLDAAHQTIRAIDQERRAEAERHRKQVDKEIIRLRGEFGEEIVALEMQLMHERSEREAAQRTIARLGGGLDEFEWPVCANDDCVNEVRSKRSNALYCSDQCKWAVQKRRARAKLAPCQNDKCRKKIEGRRKNARYCSPQCKNAAGVRRHRSNNGEGK